MINTANKAWNSTRRGSKPVGSATAMTAPTLSAKFAGQVVGSVGSPIFSICSREEPAEGTKKNDVAPI